MFSERLLFVTGKGGVGKTLTAALVAQQFEGRVLLCECRDQSELGPVLGVDLVRHKITPFSNHIDLVNFSWQGNFSDYLEKYLHAPKWVKSIVGHQLANTFLGTIPGFWELMLLGRLFYESKLNDRYDLVLFDAPATGHFRTLIHTPQSVLDARFTGPLSAESERVRDFLASDDCGYLLVTLPEPLILSETHQLLDMDIGIACRGIVQNRYVDERYTDSWAVGRQVVQTDLQGAVKGRYPLWRISDHGVVQEPLDISKLRMESISKP